MKVGLIDVDGHHYPNLALMKLSAWHKAQGDTVEWWWGWGQYDRVYMSKVFDETYTPDIPEPVNAAEIIKGGTGYGMDNKLPDEAEYKNIGKSEKGKQEQPRVGGLYTDVSDSESIRLQREWSGGDQIGGTRPEKAQSERRCDVLSDTDNGCRTLRRDGELPAVEETGGIRANHGGRAAEYVTGEWWTVEPRLGGMVDGFPCWMDEPAIPRIAIGVPDRSNRLKCLGNAVVPQQFYPIFQAIADIERGDYTWMTSN